MNLDIIYPKSCQRMPELPDESVDMCMTSPPYFSLRDYGEDVREIWGGDPNCEHSWNDATYVRNNDQTAGPKQRSNKGSVGRDEPIQNAFCLKCNAWHGQLGLEPTFQLYLDHMMIVCEEIKRVLKKTGSFWMNMGDTYGGSGGAGGDYNKGGLREGQPKYKQGKIGYAKCLLGIPWRLVLRLIDEQDWILRNCIIWEKPNSMPSSVKDRLSNSYEFLFHLVKNTESQYYWNEKTGLMTDRKLPKAKEKEGIDWDWQEVGVVDKNVFNVRVRDSETDRFMEKATEEEKKNYGKPKLKKRTYWHSLGYYYDLDAIREPHKYLEIEKRRKDFADKVHYGGQQVKMRGKNRYERSRVEDFHPSGKNPGDVWVINTQPRPETHFATFPDKLTIRPILATCPAEICKKCGKARMRITKPSDEYKKLLGTWTEDTDKSKKLRAKIGFQAHSKKVAATFEYQTIGWTDCGCNAGWDSGVLLDPFAGRGTALIMAKKMGRHYVGYELSKEYCIKLIQPALDDIDPLFNRKIPNSIAIEKR